MIPGVLPQKLVEKDITPYLSLQPSPHIACPPVFIFLSTSRFSTEAGKRIAPIGFLLSILDEIWEPWGVFSYWSPVFFAHAADLSSVWGLRRLSRTRQVYLCFIGRRSEKKKRQIPSLLLVRWLTGLCSNLRIWRTGTVTAGLLLTLS